MCSEYLIPAKVLFFFFLVLITIIAIHKCGARMDIFHYPQTSAASITKSSILVTCAGELTLFDQALLFKRSKGTEVPALLCLCKQNCWLLSRPKIAAQSVAGFDTRANENFVASTICEWEFTVALIESPLPAHGPSLDERGLAAGPGERRFPGVPQIWPRAAPRPAQLVLGAGGFAARCGDGCGQSGWLTERVAGESRGWAAGNITNSRVCFQN